MFSEWNALQTMSVSSKSENFFTWSGRDPMDTPSRNCGYFIKCEIFLVFSDHSTVGSETQQRNHSRWPGKRLSDSLLNALSIGARKYEIQNLLLFCLPCILQTRKKVEFVFEKHNAKLWGCVFIFSTENKLKALVLLVMKIAVFDHVATGTKKVPDRTN